MLGMSIHGEHTGAVLDVDIEIVSEHLLYSLAYWRLYILFNNSIGMQYHNNYDIFTDWYIIILFQGVDEVLQVSIWIVFNSLIDNTQNILCVMFFMCK